MNSKTVYTYRSGQRINLIKSPDKFVARILPQDLGSIGIQNSEQLSSSSSRVICRPEELENLMQQCRAKAPCHHDYESEESGDKYLITDRIFVRFKDPNISFDRVSEFTGRYGLIFLEKYSDRDYLFQLTNATGMNPVKLIVTLTENESLVELSENSLNHQIQQYAFTPPADPICIRLRMRDGCRTGFATPSETFAGGDPENIPDGVANPVRQNQS
ncbi:hypothetical protein [Desulfonema magnum]|uniref:Uncharacterized protein n=2 Tax=Desulfonema magnum TaxID=45655 RepID=A0A975BIR5_9BACT|nr:hypothetical protein [Desulfonema magnum]QTA86272.1 Uncharacterized protein dnm_022930 [Desulfonema magnum]